MRSEWLPVSAAALVTGVMALILGQMLNPGGSNSSPAAQVLVAAEYPGRWLTMSVLFFGGAAALVIGMPAVLSLLQGTRGRTVGLTGVIVFTIGCVGVGGLSALMLMFRALALQTAMPGDNMAYTGTIIPDALQLIHISQVTGRMIQAKKLRPYEPKIKKGENQ
jgi:hypothetical protein